MNKTPSPLPEGKRKDIIGALSSSLLTGLDLHSQIKVAHWNIKGPHFAHLHPLFDEFATGLATHLDDVAERAVILGGHVPGTSRDVAKESPLEDYPSQAMKDLEHVAALESRISHFVKVLSQSRQVSDTAEDQDTSDLLTAVIQDMEKNAWFLIATLGK